MSGDLGGMAMDGDQEVPVVHVSGQNPTPQRRNIKGKARASESDMDMLVDDEGSRWRSRGMNGSCCFLILLFIFR